MIDGVNFIDLNQKDKDKQKRIDNLSPKARAKVIRDYVDYIGRLEGTENNGEHSLFGTLLNDDNVIQMLKKDILSHINNKVVSEAYVYRAIISLAEEDAEKYGYLNREAWENVIRINIKTIADEYNIKFENLDWIASFHTEEGHPHIHLVFYDNSNKRSVAPYVEYDKIKQKLNYSVYKKEIQYFLDVKNKIKKEIKNVFKENIDDMVFYDKCKMFNNKIKKEDLNEMALKLKELYDVKNLETKGSWKMQYQSQDIKEKLREITIKIIESSSQIKREFNEYIEASIEIERIKNTNCSSSNLIEIVDNETEFMLKKIDNQVLNYLKETKDKIINERKECISLEYEKDKTEREKDYYDKLIMNVITQRMKNLFTNIYNELNNTNNLNTYFNKETRKLSQTKKERRDWALKHRDIGMIEWEK